MTKGSKEEEVVVTVTVRDLTRGRFGSGWKGKGFSDSFSAHQMNLLEDDGGQSLAGSSVPDQFAPMKLDQQ